MAKNKKLIASVAAVATSAALLLGGTLAWQSTNQTALNEASDVINPGGRLHDDFNGENKDVYVENFAEENIYARIRLEEYFEIITNYNKEGAEKTHKLVGDKTIDEETGKVDYIYDLFTDYANMQDGVVSAAIDINDVDAETGEAKSYWSWQTGGSTVYMPTFNLNKDSLLADVNGVFNGAVGNITDKDGNQYSAEGNSKLPYVDYSLDENRTKIANELYDGDANDIDEFTDGGNGNVELADIIANGDTSTYYADYAGSIELVAGEEHTATTTLGATLISMDEWLGMVKYDENGDPANLEDLGNYWVYDEDGWVYWSAPIEPHTATGLLLDSIELNQVMDDTWYYAINVVAQFVTADDVGKSDGTGFYADGQAPSAEAEELLAAIGVDVSGETATPDDGGNEEITTLVLNAYGDAEVTIERGASVKIEAESDEADLTGVLIDGNAWKESSDWTYDPDTQILTLNGPDSYYGVSDSNGSYSGTVYFESEPEYSMVLSDRYVNPGDVVTVTVYDEDAIEVPTELSVSDSSEVNGKTITIADNSSGEVTVTAKIDGISTSETLFVVDNNATLDLSIAPAYEAEIYPVGSLSLDIQAEVNGTDVLDYIVPTFEVTRPDGSAANVAIDDEDDEGGYRLYGADIPGRYSISMTAEGVTAATDELLFDHNYEYAVYLNGSDTIGGRAFIPISGEIKTLALERDYYDWDSDDWYKQEFLTVEDGVTFEVSAGEVDNNGNYIPVPLDEGEFVSDPVKVTATWTDKFGIEHTAVTYLAFYNDAYHTLATYGGGSINDDIYDYCSEYLFGDKDRNIFVDSDGRTYYCILVKFTDDENTDDSKMYESKELKKYYTSANSFSSDEVFENWGNYELCGH